ncbi:MAG: c-type cytochrome biogenesis protein CcsB, partial [Brevibacterium sp.]|nr:c-type cytochrome biogenesis protein CcsB [Brevibacterium sp.]
MDVNTDLAMWSNQLIISAMIVYAVAMIFYAFDLFGGRELKQAESGAASAAKPSTVRRTNRKATTALLDLPQTDASVETTTGSGRDKPRRGARIGTSLLVLAVILHAAAVLTRA